MKHAKRRTVPVSYLVLIAVLFCAAAALSVCARFAPGFAETYSSVVYPVLQGTIGRFSGLFPFSVSELLITVLPICIIIDLFANRKHLLTTAAHLLLLIAVLFFLYAAACGVNYYRNDFVDPEVYETQFTYDELTDLCEFIIDRVEETSGETDFQYPDRKDTASIAKQAMAGLGTEYAELSGYYPDPKELRWLSPLFSAMGVSGIYSPFTIEANINGQMPDMEKPFTACHELSHLRGYMNEGEANYIGWLACIGSDDTAFNRSGWLIAWIYAGRALERIDPDLYAQLREKLPDDAVRELDENSLFWKEHTTRASEVQDRVNDAYLKSNGLEDGVLSYDRLTTLILLWYRDHYSPSNSGVEK